MSPSTTVSVRFSSNFSFSFNASYPLNKVGFLEQAARAQTVLFELSTNNVVSSHEDSPRHHFNSLVWALARTSTLTDRNSVVQFALTTKAADVRTLLIRHSDVVEWASRAHGIEVFATSGLSPKQFLEAKKTVWGVSGGTR